MYQVTLTKMYQVLFLKITKLLTGNKEKGKEFRKQSYIWPRCIGTILAENCKSNTNQDVQVLHNTLARHAHTKHNVTRVLTLNLGESKMYWNV